jgi:hypothetical protein
LCGNAVNFITVASLNTNSVLVCVVSNLAIANLIYGVIGRVDGAGSAVSVSDEVVYRALLAYTIQNAKTCSAGAGVYACVVYGILAADVNALV